MTITSDIQNLNPGAMVDLFELDSSMLTGGSVDYFHSGVNALGNDVTWQGNLYTRYPIIASGFERNGQGSLPRPKVQVANVSGLIGALVHSMDDLIGAKLTRRRTFVKYLDAVNFPGGVNPTADPNMHFPDEIYFVDRKSSQDKIFVEFELASIFDLPGLMLPRGQIIQNTCRWLSIGGYRGPFCGYAGAAVADENDVATTDINKDKCGGRLVSCSLRFPQPQPMPFGGFPAAGLVR